MLVLAGPTGIGKTACLDAAWTFTRLVAFDLWTDGVWKKQISDGTITVERVLWADVADEVESRGGSLLSAAMRADILFIDDIGAEDDPWKRITAKLCQLLSRREHRFTFVTTNFPPSEWREKFDARIADRLWRNSVVMDLGGIKSWAMLQ